MVDAVRTLALGSRGEAPLGHTAGYFVVRALLWSAALVLVFGTLAVNRYRKG
jgi:hypothetical protein